MKSQARVNYVTLSQNLVTRALFDRLADGAWHNKDDVIAKVATSVPASEGLRWRLPKEQAQPEGLSRTIKIATGQRDIARNRVMIHTRRAGNIEVNPTDPSLIRLNPTVREGWVNFSRLFHIEQGAA